MKQPLRPSLSSQLALGQQKTISWYILVHKNIRILSRSLQFYYALQVRDAVVCLLDSWASVSPPDRLFPAVLEAIASPKCIVDGKITGLQW